MDRRPDYFHKREKRRYASRQFKNPLFNREPKRRHWLPILAPIIVVTVGSALAYLLLSPRLAISSVDISGTETISSEELSTIAWTYLQEPRFLVFHPSNRFLFDEQTLRNRIESRFAFTSLEMTRTDNTLSIAVKEKTSQLLWSSGGRRYVTDTQGVVIREAGAGEELALPVFVDLNDAPINVGAIVLTPEEIANIFRFHDHLRAQNIPFTETRIDRLAGKWMSVRTEVGYDILFDPAGTIDRQADNLATILRDTIPDTSKLEYIDLRFGDHVYYK